MNRKFLAILLIAAMLFVIMGSAQAESGVTKITIRGVDFNLPDEFEESDFSIKDDFDEDSNSTTDIMIYSSDDCTISITVIEFDDDVDDSIISDWGEKTTIKGITGYLNQTDDGSYDFSYVKDNHSVSINGPDKEFIEGLIIE